MGLRPRQAGTLSGGIGVAGRGTSAESCTAVLQGDPFGKAGRSTGLKETFEGVAQPFDLTAFLRPLSLKLYTHKGNRKIMCGHGPAHHQLAPAGQRNKRNESDGDHFLQIV